MTNHQTIADKLNSNVAPVGKRFSMTRTNYINVLPADKVVHAFEDVAIVAYTYISRKGDPALMAFVGKSNKPAIYCAYFTIEQRDKALNALVEAQRSRKDRMAKRKLERSLPHTLCVGDILVASWGYEQTNINFYQVTKLVGVRMVEIREIASQSVHNHMTYDDVVAVPDAFLQKSHLNGYKDNEPVRKLVNNNRVKVFEFADAYKWDGRPCYETNPQFGH